MVKLRGIILAGGTGSRLAPLTKQDNKHLLPVYNKRMIEYPIQTLVDTGVKDIVIVTGGNRPGAFLEYLKDGKDFGLNSLCFTYQQGCGGVADALKCAKPFVQANENIVVLLGDNYFELGINKAVQLWHKEKSAAGCLIKQTDTPWHFGIAEIKNNMVVSIEEKPSKPKSDLAILGCYYFDNQVWNILSNLQVSERGELEITDVLKYYMKAKSLRQVLYVGYWSDLGTFETWSNVSQRRSQLQ